MLKWRDSIGSEFAKDQRVRKHPIVVPILSKMRFLNKPGLDQKRLAGCVFKRRVGFNTVQSQLSKTIIQNGLNRFMHDSLPPKMGVQHVAQLASMVLFVDAPKAYYADEFVVAVLKGNPPIHTVAIQQRLVELLYQCMHFLNILVAVAIEILDHIRVASQVKKDFRVVGIDLPKNQSLGGEDWKRFEVYVEHRLQ